MDQKIRRSIIAVLMHQRRKQVPGVLTVQYAAVSALVAQRIEHLTTDRFSIFAVLNCKDPDHPSTVCAKSDA